MTTFIIIILDNFLYTVFTAEISSNTKDASIKSCESQDFSVAHVVETNCRYVELSDTSVHSNIFSFCCKNGNKLHEYRIDLLMHSFK